MISARARRSGPPARRRAGHRPAGPARAGRRRAPPARCRPEIASRQGDQRQDGALPDRDQQRRPVDRNRDLPPAEGVRRGRVHSPAILSRGGTRSVEAPADSGGGRFRKTGEPLDGVPAGGGVDHHEEVPLIGRGQSMVLELQVPGGGPERPQAGRESLDVVPVPGLAELLAVGLESGDQALAVGLAQPRSRLGPELGQEPAAGGRPSPAAAPGRKGR